MKFRLSSALLFVTVFALALGNVISWKETSAARTQLDQIRTDFGVLADAGGKTTQVSRFHHPDYRIRNSTSTRPTESFRVAPAAEAKYSLRLAEIDRGLSIDFPDVTQLTPSATIPLTSKENGDALVTCIVEHNPGTPPRMVVEINGDEALDHTSSHDWSRIASTAQANLRSNRVQYEVPPDQPIELFYWCSIPAKRAFVLWLEPLASESQR